ncbi:MAG: very short patch repair endonuclease [Spirochaetales bacterium]|nr:very short patch repair endonuclease [Spirochaetales bacterium]
MVSEARHYNMSRIRAKDTSIEVLLRHALWARGIRYRKNKKDLPGKPDITLTKYRIAVFCDGEFFHGKDWDSLKETLAKGNNPDFWIAKIARNMERDRKNDTDLAALGWTVIRFWGKSIKKDTEECIARIEEEIRKVMHITITESSEDNYTVSVDGIKAGYVALKDSQLETDLNDRELARAALSFMITKAHRRNITELKASKENTEKDKLFFQMGFTETEELLIRNRKT